MVKTVLNIFRLLILTSLVTGRAQEVSIPDPGLNAVIRQVLGKFTGPLTVADMLSLTNLYADFRYVSNLEGLGAAGNLTTLNLGENQLTSLTLPADLTSLTTLFLDGNPLTTFVLSEPLAVTSLADEIAALRSQGVSVHTYPLSISLNSAHRTVPGAFEFTLTGPPGNYTVLGSTNLSIWSELGSLTNQLGAAIFTDAEANPQKFYRAESAP